MTIRKAVFFSFLIFVTAYTQEKPENSIEPDIQRQADQEDDGLDSVDSGKEGKKIVKQSGGSGEDTAADNGNEKVNIPESVSDSSLQTDNDFTVEGENEEPESGTLHIKTVPDSAVIILDGENMGKTPLTLKEITAGKHSLEVRKKGFYLKKVTINSVSGMDESITFRLTEPGKINIISDPADAHILINEKVQGETPFVKNTIKPGTYNISVIKKGFKQIDREITVNSGEEKKLNFKLESAAEKAEDKQSVLKEDDVKKSEETEQKSDNDKKSLINRISIGLFIAFSLIIIIVEIADS